MGLGTFIGKTLLERMKAHVNFDKCPKSKLWYCCNGINNIEFDGCEIIKRPKLPDKYFTIENKMTEKIDSNRKEFANFKKTGFKNIEKRFNN